MLDRGQFTTDDSNLEDSSMIKDNTSMLVIEFNSDDAKSRIKSYN
jgi:hypothetical protein